MNDRGIDLAQQRLEIVGIFRWGSGHAGIRVVDGLITRFLQPILQQAHPQAMDIQAMH